MNENYTAVGQADDGPRFLHPKSKSYFNYSIYMADKLGMSVADWLIDMDTEFEDHDTDGILATVSFFPTGDPDSHGHGTDYYPEVSDRKAFKMWKDHIDKVSTIATGYGVVDYLGADIQSKRISESELRLGNTGDDPLLKNNIDDTNFSDLEVRELINPDVCNDDLPRPSEYTSSVSNSSIDESYTVIPGGYKKYICDTIGEVGLNMIMDVWIAEVIDVYPDISNTDICTLIEANFVGILNEKTYRDLRSNAPEFLRIRDKSKLTPGSKYQTIDDDNVIHYKTPSHTTPGLVYDQKVKLLDLEELLNTQAGIKKPIEIVRLALEGDIAVHCTDPSWKYWGFQYIGTKEKYATDSEPRFPKIRNPNLKGSVCKHLDNVLYVLPFHNTKILSDLKKQNRL